MKTGEGDHVLECFLEEIHRRLGVHLKQVVLFGSRARGDHVDGSDYDCLLVVDRVSTEVKEMIDEVAGELLFQYNAVFSLFPVSEKEYRQQTNDPFLRNIRHEGIVM